MSKAEQPTSDREWQAEDDARTLEQSLVIQGDKKRLGRARKAAIKLATKKRKEANAIEQVAKGA